MNKMCKDATKNVCSVDKFTFDGKGHTMYTCVAKGGCDAKGKNMTASTLDMGVVGGNYTYVATCNDTSNGNNTIPSKNCTSDSDCSSAANNRTKCATGKTSDGNATK